ncbi:MAG: hypothetical protein R3C11_27400 [Planctomycetaceae bacterium]
MASYTVQNAGLVKFNPGQEWKQLPPYLQSGDFYFTLIKSKRNKYPTSISAKIAETGLMVMATPITEPPLVDPELKDESPFTYVAPEDFLKEGWEPFGVIIYQDHPHVLMRKQIETKQAIEFSVQGNLSPFLFTTSKAEHVQAIKDSPVVSLQNPQIATSTTESENGTPQSTVTFNFPTEGAEGAEGGPKMEEPMGGVVGTLFGLAKAITGAGDGPPPAANDLFSGGPAQPEDQKKELFIKNVDLSQLKCPVERQPVSLEFHAEHNGGIVFFSNQAAVDAFTKDSDDYAAPANYQLFLTDQATQINCPISNNEMNDEYTMPVGSGKEVAFSTRSNLSRLETAAASYKLNKIFGDAPFQRSFEVSIPKVTPRAIDTKKTTNQDDSDDSESPGAIRRGKKRDRD